MPLYSVFPLTPGKVATTELLLYSTLNLIENRIDND